MLICVRTDWSVGVLLDVWISGGFLVIGLIYLIFTVCFCFLIFVSLANNVA